MGLIEGMGVFIKELPKGLSAPKGPSKIANLDLVASTPKVPQLVSVTRVDGWNARPASETSGQLVSVTRGKDERNAIGSGERSYAQMMDSNTVVNPSDWLSRLASLDLRRPQTQVGGKNDKSNREIKILAKRKLSEFEESKKVRNEELASRREQYDNANRQSSVNDMNVQLARSGIDPTPVLTRLNGEENAKKVSETAKEVSIRARRVNSQLHGVLEPGATPSDIIPPTLLRGYIYEGANQDEVDNLIRDNSNRVRNERRVVIRGQKLDKAYGRVSSANTEEAKQLRGDLDRVMQEYVNGQITRGQFEQWSSRIRDRIEGTFPPTIGERVDDSLAYIGNSVSKFGPQMNTVVSEVLPREINGMVDDFEDLGREAYEMASFQSNRGKRWVGRQTRRAGSWVKNEVSSTGGVIREAARQVGEGFDKEIVEGVKVVSERAKNWVRDEVVDTGKVIGKTAKDVKRGFDREIVQGVKTVVDDVKGKVDEVKNFIKTDIKDGLNEVREQTIGVVNTADEAIMRRADKFRGQLEDSAGYIDRSVSQAPEQLRFQRELINTNIRANQDFKNRVLYREILSRLPENNPKNRSYRDELINALHGASGDPRKVSSDLKTIAEVIGVQLDQREINRRLVSEYRQTGGDLGRLRELDGINVSLTDRLPEDESFEDEVKGIGRRLAREVGKTENVGRNNISADERKREDGVLTKASDWIGRMVNENAEDYRSRLDEERINYSSERDSLQQAIKEMERLGGEVYEAVMDASGAGVRFVSETPQNLAKKLELARASLQSNAELINAKTWTNSQFKDYVLFRHIQGMLPPNGSNNSEIRDQLIEALHDSKAKPRQIRQNLIDVAKRNGVEIDLDDQDQKREYERRLVREYDISKGDINKLSQLKINPPTQQIILPPNYNIPKPKF